VTGLAESPIVVILAGPNGAGKTTAAPRLLRDALAVEEYVSADGIAAGLSAFRPGSVALEAAKAMLARLDELEAARLSFGFETTLASIGPARRMVRLRQKGYRVHLAFLSLPSSELAIARVAGRVRDGGHHVPADIVRWRFAAGLRNFRDRYRVVTDAWQLYDNAAGAEPHLIARSTPEGSEQIFDQAAWDHLMEQAL